MLLHPRGTIATVNFTLGFFSTTSALGALQTQLCHIVRAVTVVVCMTARQSVLDRAMHQQIRITPDRRGEMRVGIQGQTKMTVIL